MNRSPATTVLFVLCLVAPGSAGHASELCRESDQPKACAAGYACAEKAAKSSDAPNLRVRVVYGAFKQSCCNAHANDAARRDCETGFMLGYAASLKEAGRRGSWAR